MFSKKVIYLPLFVYVHLLLTNVIKLFRGARYVPSNSWLRFVADLDHCMDTVPEFFKGILQLQDMTVLQILMVTQEAPCDLFWIF